MRQSCMEFCQDHDKAWQMKDLDFLQCYIGYIVDIQKPWVKIQEFVPGESLIGAQGKIHLMPIEYLPRRIDIKIDGFNRVIFRFQYDNASQYYFLAPSAIKTAHLRIGMPNHPSLDSVVITANIYAPHTPV